MNNCCCKAEQRIIANDGKICIKAKKKTQAISLSPLFYGAPGAIRTPDLRIRSPLLYPAELQAHVKLKFKKRLNIKIPYIVQDNF